MPDSCNSNIGGLTSLESTEQRAVLTLSFEHYSLKLLDREIQEGPRDSLSGTAPHVSAYYYVTYSAHD